MSKTVFLCLLFFAGATSSSAEVKNAVQDRLTPPALKDCRLQGKIGTKADTFFYRRCWGPEGRGLVMPEAEFAFTHPDDDVFNPPVGMWKGEFWGKLALSGARVATYRDDADYKAFLLGSAHRLMACQRPDGYLGTYVDPRFVCPPPVEKARAVFGWDCEYNWNLWCRKYTMWGLLAIYEVTGDKAVLDAAAKAMRQQIGMLREMGLKLCDTGTTPMCGLPPCSILKPLVRLYRETGDELFREYAAEIVSYWDRDGNPPPNFFRNAVRDVPIYEWYAGAPRKPTKMYEMLSCLDGLLEYYRLTGEARCLDCVAEIADNIWRNERNALDSIGYNDNFANGARHLNGSTEPCDIVHWMRLNYDLYLLTGDVKYVDIIELAYYNAFQAAVFKDGAWGAREVRSHVRHMAEFGQSGMRRQHCCVNNLPRGYMDVAEVNATMDGVDRLRVNLYSDFTSAFDDVSVSVSGDFPFAARAVAKLIAKRPMKVAFRLPAWGTTLKFTALPDGEAREGTGRWFELDIPDGMTSVRIDFDMTIRLVDLCITEPMDEKRARMRWEDYGMAPDFVGTWRTEPAARLYYGPLLLAKTQYWGETRQEVLRADMNGGGWKVMSSRPLKDNRTMGAWTVEFGRGDERRSVRVCDFGSAGDFVSAPFASTFSIWF